MLDGKAFGAEIVEIVQGYFAKQVAPLVERNAALEARLEAVEKREIIHGRDGRDGMAGANGIGIHKAVVSEDGILLLTFTDGSVVEAGLVRGADGRDGINGKDGSDGRDGADGANGKDGAAGLDGRPGERGSDGRDGQDGAPGADGQPGENGKDGADGRDGQDGEPGRDGQPGEAGKDGSDGRDGIDGQNGRDGEPGKDGADGTPGERGQDGKDADPAEIAVAVASEVSKAVAGLPVPQNGKDGRHGIDGKDGVGLASALIGRNGELIVTLTNGDTKDLGLIIGKDGEPGRDGADGKNGAAGTDGLGFDDMTETVEDDGRTIVRRYQRGDEVKEFRHTLAVPIDRGVYKDGQAYKAGDGVTLGGSWWLARKDTEARPDSGSEDWRLAVKRGRDGKDGKDGERGLQGKTGEAGKDLTQLGPSGQKW